MAANMHIEVHNAFKNTQIVNSTFTYSIYRISVASGGFECATTNVLPQPVGIFMMLSAVFK